MPALPTTPSRSKKHYLLPDNLADGFIETHVQESISFIEDQKPDLIKGDFATSQEILYTAWRADQDVATFIGENKSSICAIGYRALFKIPFEAWLIVRS